MDREKRKMWLKNFWRKNERMIVLITTAALVGILIAALNTWNYQNSRNKFQLDEPMQITNDRDASFSFKMNNPDLTSRTNLELQIDNMKSSTVIVLKVNGQKLDEITSTEKTVEIPAQVLRNDNRVTLSKKRVGFASQKLVEAHVTSITSLHQIIFVLINFGALIMVFLPIGYVKYQEYLQTKRMEKRFPDFLRDLVEGIRAGMSLPQAIQNTESGDYGPLTPKIEKMSAQIEWGVPFEKVLKNFGDETGSPTIRRSVDTIIQAYTSGGHVQDVLESVGDNLRSIKQLRQERQSQLYGEMITGYVVYFIFIGILIALTTYLLPSLADASESLGGGLAILGADGGATLTQNISLYKKWFTRLVYIQAVASGLIIGKLSEGKLKAGLKHAAILFATGYLAITFFL